MCTIVFCFVFFISSHVVVSLFSLYEFDCPSGVFRHFFVWLNQCLNSGTAGYGYEKKKQRFTIITIVFAKV